MKRNQSKSGSRRPKRGPDTNAREFPAELALLAHVAPHAPAPSAKIKHALLAKIAEEKSPAAKPADPGWRFDSVKRSDGWLKMSFPGVRMKELSLDTQRNSALVLVEIARGCQFPDHDHRFADEGLILSGSVQSGGRRLVAGDYYYAGSGSTHTDIVSADGCTALVHLAAPVWQKLRTHAEPVR